MCVIVGKYEPNLDWHLCGSICGLPIWVPPNLVAKLIWVPYRMLIRDSLRIPYGAMWVPYALLAGMPVHHSEDLNKWLDLVTLAKFPRSPRPYNSMKKHSLHSIFFTNGQIHHAFCRLLFFFFKINPFFKKNQIKKKSFSDAINVSNSLYPDQAKHFEPQQSAKPDQCNENFARDIGRRRVPRTFPGADLGPNCLQRLSADDTSTERV